MSKSPSICIYGSPLSSSRSMFGSQRIENRYPRIAENVVNQVVAKVQEVDDQQVTPPRC